MVLARFGALGYAHLMSTDKPMSDKSSTPAKTLGERLSGLRGERTQDDVVADLVKRGVDVSRQALSHWEMDRAAPGPRAILALADVYGVPVAEMLALAAVPFGERVRVDGRSAGQKRPEQAA